MSPRIRMRSMMSVTRGLALAGLLFLGACASSHGGSGDSDCICGTASAAIHGCHHAECKDGKTNPENPDCHCGPIHTAGDKGDS